MMFIERDWNETNDLKSTMKLWGALTINACAWGAAAGLFAVLGGSVYRDKIALTIITASAPYEQLNNEKPNS